jgi:hypothetical protein
MNGATSPSGSPEHGRSARWGFIAIALLAGAALGFVIGLLVFDDEDDAAAKPPAATVTRIVDSPDKFIGERTLVSGAVKEVISPHAFTITRPGLLGRALLVVTKEPVAAPTGRSATRPILEGDIAQVYGEVRKFDASEFERDLGVELKREFDTFPGDDLRERKGDPAVRALSVVYSAGTTPVAEAGSAEEIVQRPREFYGKIVSIDGRVTDILRSGALVIDDELLALTADFAQGKPKEGQRVRIVGPVRRFDPDQLRPGGKSLPDDEIFGRFADRPAVVAQSIEIQR